MIRNYRKEDYTMIASWWSDHKEVGPTPEMLPEESTFILEAQGTPWICVTVYLMNTNEFAWVDNLIANPNISDTFRKQAVQELQEYLEEFAHKKGYKRLFCFSYKNALGNRYQELGYKKTCDNVTTFMKEIR